MKLLLNKGDGRKEFVDAAGEVWSSEKNPGEFGVTVTTKLGSAGFIFDNRELAEFVAAAQLHLAREAQR